MPQNREVGLDETARPSDPRKAMNSVTDSGVIGEMGKGEGIGKGQKSVPASPVDLPSGLG